MAPSKLRSWLRNGHRGNNVDERKAKQTVEEDTKATSSNVTEQQVPSVNPPVIDELVTIYDAKTSAKTAPSATVSAAQQTPTLPISQRLWNDAYDSLENDKGTTELVKAYIKTLTTVLTPEDAANPSGPETCTASVKPRDPIKRQIDMKKLVEAGQAKVTMASKITEGIGDVAQFILSAKGMIDLAIQNIPQAALPWAGVCIGLQVSYNLSLFDLLFPCQLIFVSI